MRRRRVDGFTYLAALFAVAIVSGGLALAGEAWHTAALREREAELLFAGNQYRLAIGRYYRAGPGQYPRRLEDLLADPRKPSTERYLRRLFPDPVAGEWGLIPGPDGGIMGVHSRSEAKPLKTANFRPRDQEFEGAVKYSDWKFIYVPGLQVPPQAAAGQPAHGARP